MNKRDDDMEDLKVSITALTISVGTLVQKIDSLIDLHHTMVKWLVWIVGTIALGKGALEVLQLFIKHGG